MIKIFFMICATLLFALYVSMLDKSVNFMMIEKSGYEIVDCNLFFCMKPKTMYIMSLLMIISIYLLVIAFVLLTPL